MKKILLIILFVMILSVSTACGPSMTNPDDDYCVRDGDSDVFVCTKPWSSYFDTSITLKLYIGPDHTEDVAKTFEDVEAEFRTFHRLFDKYHAYDGLTNVYAINHDEDGTAEISETLYDAISFALEHDEDVTADDAILFNLALDPVSSVWHDAREAENCEIGAYYNVCDVPDMSQRGPFNTDPGDIILSEDPYAITFAEDGMSIDMGGFGKGYAAEKVTDYLDERNMDYLLNMGHSNVKAGGGNPTRDDGLFYIALTRPTLGIPDHDQAGYYAIVKIPGQLSLVTSGNYQRYFKGRGDGEYYHHIIDPRTHYPGGEAMSVTVLTDDGGLADIYSTAIYLLSVEEGLAAVNDMDDLEAIWYLSGGDVVMSDGFSDYIYELDNQTSSVD